MSVKKSRVSLNYKSSEEEVDSDLDENQINDEFDDNINNVEESDDNDLEDGDKDGTSANSGWADAISKVLAVKGKGITKKKSIILSKAKKDKDLKRKSDEPIDSLELVKSDGTVVQSIDKSNKRLKIDGSVGKKKKKNKLSHTEWEVMHKQKPKEDDKERERRLCSIATKGVVQLFNAVREQQKTIETKIKEVGGSETKRDKMLSQFNKNQFLDKLKQKDNKPNKNKNTETETQEKGGHKWKVLRNDFMIGAKMKDWNKDSDSDQESND